MADVVAVPGRLNITVWAGNTEQLELTWPAGSLDGLGPWTATATAPGHDPLNLPVTVNVDVQTITLPEGTDELLHTVGSWVLVDASSGNDVIAGTFRVIDQPGPSTLTATVQIVDEAVTVDVLSDAPVSSVNGETGAVTLDAADVGADPTGSAQTVAADLATHEADESVHGWTVTGGNIMWNGAILTDHDARYFDPMMMVGTAQLNTNAGTLNAPPLWQFDASVVERVKWLWTPGDGWSTYTIRFGWMNSGFATGNVTWRYYERRTRVNSGAPEGNWTTNPVLINTFTATIPTLDANRYENLAVDVPVEPLTIVLSVIDRFATDATDTLAADASLYIATATRTS